MSRWPRPNSPQEWAEFYAEQEAKRAAAQACEEAQTAKAQRPAVDHMVPHPLVSRPSFPAETPLDVQELHINSYLYWRDHGAALVRAQRDRAATEAERAGTPHLMTQHPFVQIPIPGSLPKNSPRKPPTPGKSIK